MQKFGFRDVEILEQGNIEIQGARPMEGAARCVSKGTQVGLREGVQIEIRLDSIILDGLPYIKHSKEILPQVPHTNIFINHRNSIKLSSLGRYKIRNKKFLLEYHH